MELDEIRHQFRQQHSQQYNNTQVQPMQTQVMPKPYDNSSEPPPPYQPTRDYPQPMFNEGSSELEGETWSHINGSRYYNNLRPRTMVNHASIVPLTQTNFAPLSTSDEHTSASNGLSSTSQGTRMMSSLDDNTTSTAENDSQRFVVRIL